MPSRQFGLRLGAWRSVLADGDTPTVVDYVAGSVPEPSTWMMMALGFAALGAAGHRAARRTVAA